TDHSVTPAFSGFVKQEWVYGDQTSDISPAPAPHWYKQPGMYNLSLRVETNYGCTDFYQLPKAVTVYKPPAVAINGPLEQCEETTGEYLSQIISEDAIMDYRWTLNGTQLSDKNTASYLFATAG